MTSLTDALANFSIHRDGRNTLVVRSRLTVEELEQALAAARRVAQAPEVNWCDFHLAAGQPGLDCWAAGINGQDSCRMVRKLLVDPAEET